VIDFAKLLVLVGIPSGEPPLSTALRFRLLPLSLRAAVGVGAKPAVGDCGEAGETPAPFPHETHCSQVFRPTSRRFHFFPVGFFRVAA
jgi:hypothetical protein